MYVVGWVGGGRLSGQITKGYPPNLCTRGDARITGQPDWQDIQAGEAIKIHKKTRPCNYKMSRCTRNPDLVPAVMYREVAGGVALSGSILLLIVNIYPQAPGQLPLLKDNWNTNLERR